MGGGRFSGMICPTQVLRKNKRKKGKNEKMKKGKKNFKEFLLGFYDTYYAHFLWGFKGIY